MKVMSLLSYPSSWPTRVDGVLDSFHNLFGNDSRQRKDYFRHTHTLVTVISNPSEPWYIEPCDCALTASKVFALSSSYTSGVLIIYERNQTPSQRRIEQYTRYVNCLRILCQSDTLSTVVIFDRFTGDSHVL